MSPWPVVMKRWLRRLCRPPPRIRRKIRRLTVSPTVPVLVGMDLSEQEGPSHIKTFRGVWEDKAFWEEIRARKPRYRVRTPKEPPPSTLSPPSQTFSASTATPVPPAPLLRLRFLRIAP